MSLSITIHYDEIGLKGKNRSFFEKKLQKNIKNALAPIAAVSTRTLLSRVILTAPDPGQWPEISAILSRIFGIAHFERIWKVPADLDAITAQSLVILPDQPDLSFRVTSSRPDKSFPMPSMEMNRRIGAAVQQARNWRVDLTNPDVTLYIKIIGKKAMLSAEKQAGPGGLPAGVGGRVVCLLSGGIDSPVAAHRLMRRGAQPVFVHFHSYPFTGKSSQERARHTVQHLLGAQPPAPLWFVPLGDIQQHIVENGPPPLRILLYRRFMFRLAQRIAQREKALAMVTGEALGQVASQTLENMAAVEAAVTLPVLRPLVGLDKREIIREAKAIGTFEQCICGEDDCCSYLLPPNVATHSSDAALTEAEKNLPVEDLASEAINQADVEQMTGKGPDR